MSGASLLCASTRAAGWDFRRNLEFAGMNTVRLIVYSAADMSKSKALFTALLGAEPYAESPYYTGFRAGEIEIGLTPQAAAGVTGAIAYVDVPDIREALTTAREAGAELLQDVTDVANGLLIAVVKDPNGTPIGLREQPNA